jgi:hypothetical protein
MKKLNKIKTANCIKVLGGERGVVFGKPSVSQI